MNTYSIKIVTKDEEWIDEYEYDESCGLTIEEAVNRMVDQCKITWACTARRVFI